MLGQIQKNRYRPDHEAHDPQKTVHGALWHRDYRRHVPDHNVTIRMRLLFGRRSTPPTRTRPARYACISAVHSRQHLPLKAPMPLLAADSGTSNILHCKVNHIRLMMGWGIVLKTNRGMEGVAGTE
jgi:hypothetical protein